MTETFGAVHPSLLTRKIIHVDMDAFFAAIEERDDPSLKGKPVVVGGNPNSRGVVSTANYEARKFGIRSAMSAAHAKRLCPHAIFLRPRFEAYKHVSNQVKKILFSVTPTVEPLSLDEAYLDVSQHPSGKYAMEIAKDIKQQIFETTSLTASAGVAPNKMLAKIASDINKPNGLAIIRPTVVAEFMKTLPVNNIHGVGPVTAKKLASLGILVCGDVSEKYTLESLKEKLGASSGEWLFWLAQGIDERPVETYYERKSFGNESTFSKDLSNLPDMHEALAKLTEELCETISKRGITAKTVTLKVRYADFKRITRAKTLTSATNNFEEIFATLKALLEHTEATTRKVRLLGLSLSHLHGVASAQSDSSWED